MNLYIVRYRKPNWDFYEEEILPYEFIYNVFLKNHSEYSNIDIFYKDIEKGCFSIIRKHWKIKNGKFIDCRGMIINEKRLKNYLK